MILTTLCYIEKDDAYLMLHRTKKENDVNKDKWIGIGGKLLENESPEECMLREVYEETGLTINSFQFRAVITFISAGWGSEQIYLFTSEDFSGTIHECDEGDLLWVKKNTLSSLNLWDGDKIFLSLLDSGSDFFSLKLSYDGNHLVEAKLNNKDITPGSDR